MSIKCLGIKQGSITRDSIDCPGTLSDISPFKSKDESIKISFVDICRCQFRGRPVQLTDGKFKLTSVFFKEIFQIILTSNVYKDDLQNLEEEEKEKRRNRI